MLGFIFGTLCLIGLVKVLRGPRWHGRMGWGRRGRFLRRVFSRLETSPSQENAIVDALAEVRSGGRQLMPEIAATRAEIARLLRQDSFDRSVLDAVFARHDRALSELRALTSSALERVHGVLDVRQRGELAALLERTPTFWGGGGAGPYREQAAL
jgi:Spy/CpxP family protein refolding chaperone